MHLWRLLPVLAAVALLLSGCGGGGPGGWCKVTGSGAKVTKTMDLPSYTKMEVDSAIETQVSVGSGNAFSINLFSNVVDYLDVQVVGDTLRIKMKEGACNAQAKAAVKVTSPLEGLMANGASHVTVDQLNGTLSANGASQVDVTDTLSSGPITCTGASPVTIKTFTSTSAASINSEGASTLEVKNGSSPHVQVTASGASTIKLDSFIATQADLSVSGASRVSGMVADTLTVEVSGASDIASTVKVKASGSCTEGGSVTILGGADTTSVSTSGGCTLSASGQAASLLEISI